MYIKNIDGSVRQQIAMREQAEYDSMLMIYNKSTFISYGDTLLNAMGAGGNYKDNLASVTLSEGMELLKERLDAIMNFKKSTRLTRTISIVLTLALSFGATAVGAYAAPVNQTPATPWEAMGNNNGQPYTYSQESYYQAPYIFEIGRNLNEQGDKSYPDKATIILSNKTTITVSFDVSCKEYASDVSALATLKPLLEKLIEKYADSSLPMEKPLIVGVYNVGNSDLNKLAEEYYTNHESNKFYAIFSSLDEEIQKDYCTKMIENGENAFLAGTAKFMESDMVNFCLEKTYQEGNIALFAGIVPCLNNDQKQTWIARASRDDKNNFLAVLTR